MEPHEKVAQLLQNNLTDYNTSRTGSWIFTRYPDVNEMTEFPIIVVEEVGEPSQVFGLGVDDTWDTVQIEITILTRRGVFVSGMENQKLVDTLARDVKKLLRTKWKTDLTGFYNFEIVNNTPLPFDDVRMLYGRSLIVQFNLINAGE